MTAQELPEYPGAPDSSEIAFVRQQPLMLLTRAWRSVGGKIGIVLVMAVTLLALLGPLFTPFSPTETIGTPFQPASGVHVLGTDFLGRDALSRFLAGGRSVLGLATGATVITYLICVPLGALMGFKRSWPDLVTLGLADLLISFPPLVFTLVMFALTGPHAWVIIVAVLATAGPRVVRIIRSVVIELASLEYVESAIARGESTTAILWRELLPNLWTPLIADFGVRLTGAFLLASALGYLGLGLTPPDPNWGVMVSENRLGLTAAPLTVIAPALAIACFAIGVNLFSDAIAHALGHSVLTRGT